MSEKKIGSLPKQGYIRLKSLFVEQSPQPIRHKLTISINLYNTRFIVMTPRVPIPSLKWF